MDHLWAPWRMAYIKGDNKRVDGCVFCNKVHGDDATEYVLHRSEYVFVALNLYPYNNGHLMVIPYEHIATQERLSTEALTDLMVTINRALAALRTAYNPPAFNLGANIGVEAGAGIAEHYHYHVVPRWANDSNFMTAIGNTRIVPASLDETYRDLKAAWKS